MGILDSLAKGRAVMGGQGVDPATLYGVPPSASSPVGAFSPTGTGGAPSSPMLPAQAGSSASAQAPNAMPTAMPLHGSVPSPAQGGSGVLAGVDSTAPLTVGPNSMGLHPATTHDQLLNYLLPRVRNVESQGNYQADRSTTHPGQTASGAYQYIDSTWNNYKGYKRAVDAPPEVQEARAKEDFSGRLKKYGGDIFKATADHYFPRYADDPGKWNEPLTDAHGNAIKGAEPVASYLSKILPPARVQGYMQQATTPPQTPIASDSSVSSGYGT